MRQNKVWANLALTNWQRHAKYLQIVLSMEKAFSFDLLCVWSLFFFLMLAVNLDNTDLKSWSSWLISNTMVICTVSALLIREVFKTLQFYVWECWYTVAARDHFNIPCIRTNYTQWHCDMKQTSQIWHRSSAKIWNRTQPRALVQNQHTRELISVRKKSHKHINKDLSHLQLLSPGMHVMGMYLWWSLRTLYLHACQVRVTVGDSGLCCCTCVTYSAC